MDITQQLIAELDLQEFQVKNTLELFNEGATIPFIARYRKERTGSLDEIKLRSLQQQYEYYTELEDRKKTIVESIESQGKLTDELRKKIEATVSKVELEDLYLPYKPKRVTRGKKAMDAGLEPLARYLVECSDHSALYTVAAEPYLTETAREKGFDSVEKILAGACDILAEELSDTAQVRKWMRELVLNEGMIVSSVRKEFTDKKSKFSMYYNYREPVKGAPSHRVLALLRGEREKVLAVTVEFPQDKVLGYLDATLIKHPSSATAELLRKTTRDCLDRLLSTAVETEIRQIKRESAEVEACAVFGENLRTVLMAAPAGGKRTLGIDPGFRTGCKVVALDETGKFLEFRAVYPNEPQKDIKGATSVLLDMIHTHEIELIAIGNGTASRETERFVRQAIGTLEQQKQPVCVIISEAGASVYSASEVAGREFPDQDVTVRGAISIARRLQDPLSELVKIDPKSIGVGQYQHDVNQKLLKESLDTVVESCVNRVGVELNQASNELLQYVSGLNSKIAGNIVKYRQENGLFSSREQLKEVSGIGARIFEQAAGFLRIRNGVNPLDNSAVHPERYGFVQQLALQLGTTIDTLISNTSVLKKIDKKQYVSESMGLETINDILAELEKPGRDPRDAFAYARFSETVQDIADCKPGMVLEGYVTNVTNFGAFVDIGVHQDGLVHISELADRFVSDPSTVVKTGQIVKVTVLSVDTDLKRIALSMRSRPETVSTERIGGSGGQSTKYEKTTTSGNVNRLKDWAGKDKKHGSSGTLKTLKPKFNIKQIMK